MKKHLLFLSTLLLLSGATLHAQENTKKRGIGWYITPEYSTLFLNDHVGSAVGFSAGIKLLRDHLKIGYFNYGRSGPINAHTYATPLPEGITYKGQRTVNLRADHGAFGLMVAPSFYIPRTNIVVDIPIYYGSIGAGFYLAGDDRKTPDNRRVSEWENELFDGQDAAFAPLLEIGIRSFFPTGVNGLRWGVGLHYTTVQDWTTYVDSSGDFYNNKFRASVFIDFGSASKR